MAILCKEHLEKIQNLLLKKEDTTQASELIIGLLESKEELIEIFEIAFNLGCQVQRNQDEKSGEMETVNIMLEDVDGYEDCDDLQDLFLSPTYNDIPVYWSDAGEHFTYSRIGFPAVFSISLRN